MRSTQPQSFPSVYGPVRSWRYGQSLGVDPIGEVSTCSFNCVYCQLGEIEHQQTDRRIFVPTAQIEADLQPFAPWDMDVITLSGSGEPTLALNLGDILVTVKRMTGKPVGVLTNGSLLHDPAVRAELSIADRVAVKVDGIGVEEMRRINRPVHEMNQTDFWASLQKFRQHYTGQLAIQTMLLSPWSDRDQAIYTALMYALKPDEIHLNTPTRPKPIHHPLDSRSNHPPDSLPYLARSLRTVHADVLEAFADRIQTTIGIPVRYPQSA